jgi:hypothetical protein
VYEDCHNDLILIQGMIKGISYFGGMRQKYDMNGLNVGSSGGLDYRLQGIGSHNTLQFIFIGVRTTDLTKLTPCLSVIF